MTPLATLAKMKVKIDEKMWEVEEAKQEEIPESLQESGTVIVSVKDVRDSIGVDREGWRLLMDSE